MGERVSKKGKKKNKRLITKREVIVIVGCLILMALVVAYEGKVLISEKAGLQSQRAELEAELEQAQREYSELEQRQAYMSTDEYVEDVARSQLGLVYPDEIVIKPEE